jgi:hypothetical protein
MHIPSADQFRSEPGSGVPVRYWAAIPGTGYDLHVPEGADFEPDAASLAFAEAVLSDLDAILDEAVEHVRRYVDVDRLGLAGRRPEPTGVFCDAGRERVEVSFSWEVQLYTLWTVAFRWGGAGRRTPVELSVRPF